MEHKETLSDQDRLTQLVEEELNIRGEIADLKAILSEARRKAAATRVYSDRGWYTDTERKLRDAQVDHQTVLLEAGELRRKINRDRHNRRAPIEVAEVEAKRRMFIETCKRRLDFKTFDALWEETEKDYAESLNEIAPALASK